MQNFVTSLVRDFAQKAVGVIAVWLLAHTGIEVPDAVKDWAVLVAVGAALFVWTGLVRALESADPSSFTGKVAHRIARLLMLGIKAKPAYSLPASTPRPYTYPQ